MRTIVDIKLLILFAVSFSLVGLSGSLANSELFPRIGLARGSGPTPDGTWMPAGPAMDTEKANIFTPFSGCDELCSFIAAGGGKAGSLDLTDLPLSSAYLSCLENNVGCPSGVDFTKFSVSSMVPEKAYYEIQFDLANNFWGVPFNFGNDDTCTAGAVSYSLTLANPKTDSTAGLSTPCPGVSIRQGIAHLIDKNLFTVDQSTCSNRCNAIDSPEPPSTAIANDLTTPDTCGWDTLFSVSLELGPCEIGPIPGTGQVGGISYHFAMATACGVSNGCGTDTPLFPWEPGLGTPDFCAAADHFIAAALATGKDPNTCVLTGIAPGVTAHTVNVFARVGQPSYDLGNSFADELCALFTGQFGNVASGQSVCEYELLPKNTVNCVPVCYVTFTSGTSPGFPGYYTSSGSSIYDDWWIYTGSFVNVFPFDSSLFGNYNSIFAPNNGGSDVPPCSSVSVSTVSASDYVYNCVPLYDQLSNAMEFSSCVSSSNSPSPGQTNPTLGNCSGGMVTGLCNLSTNPCDAVSAAYQAENLFGEQAVTIPVFSQMDQYGYLADMQNVINSAKTGIPQFYTWLNARTTTPAGPGSLQTNCPSMPNITGPDCFRQGFSENTRSLSPYSASTFWDFNIIGNIYDSLLGANPMSPGQLYGYLSTGFPTQLSNSQLGYTPADGTTVSYRFTLRKDISWQDGTALTSWDVKFSYVTLKATGALQATGLSQVIDVHVLGPRVFDVNLSTSGPFTLFSLGAPTIIPGRLWSAAGKTAWDSALSMCATSSTPDSCFSTANPSAMTVATSVTSASYDPIANGVLVGSSQFECAAISGLPNPSGVAIGGGCSDTGTQNPSGASAYYQLTRYGGGTTPGVADPSSKYFRSSGTLAVYIWTGNNGGSTHDFINDSTVTYCFNKPVGTSGCTQWQQGIANPSAGGAPVGFLQISAVSSFQGVQWTGPFNWIPGIPYACCPFSANSPTGIATLPLTLYEGISTGNAGNPFPANTPQVLLPAAVAGCTVAYPTGGYDC